MNNKRAKQIRRTARLAMAIYVKDNVLQDEESSKLPKNGLYKVLPKRMTVWKAFTRQEAMYTQRWFYKRAKKLWAKQRKMS